jgi:hypothetical protein
MLLPWTVGEMWVAPDADSTEETAIKARPVAGFACKNGEISDG